MIGFTQTRAHIGRSWRAIAQFTVEQLLAEGPSLRKARRAVLKQIDDATDAYGQETARLTKIADSLTDDDLRDCMGFEEGRRKLIDERAKANLVAITIGLTVLLGSLNFVGKTEFKATLAGPWGIVAFGLLVSGVVYLIYGGLKALDALRIERVYSPSPADQSGVCRVMRRAQMLWCLEQNQRTTILRTNAVSVSYRSIRNGVISLAVLILFVAGRIVVILSKA